MALNITKWDERIIEDYDNIKERHALWQRMRDLMNNEKKGTKYGNLAREFSASVRSRLLSANMFVKVGTDDPNFAQKGQEMTVMANSVARSIDLKEVLDDATEESLWSGTGWVEVGHSLDIHSFDPDRTVLYRNENQFEIGDLQDEYTEVSEEEVRSDLGNEIENVLPFDPLEDNSSLISETKPENEPLLTFDPKFGTPWTKVIAPFFIVVPPKTKKFRDADYITKLVILSKPELERMVDFEVPDDAGIDSRFQTLLDETPGGKYIDNPVVVAITYIRRDRNDPDYAGWYLAHLVGYPSLVIKSSPNPYGGMIPLIPAKSSSSGKIIGKSYIEHLEPYATEYGTVLEGVFRRMRLSLSTRWSMGSNGSLDNTNEQNMNNPNFNGQIKMKSGNPESLQYLDGPGITQDMVHMLNLVSKLAQQESGQSDLDQGTPIKKISARQTAHLIESSSLMMSAIRAPVVKAGSEIILKIIHLLNLFAPPREHVYKFGPDVVSLEPGGNDFTTSYEYKISIKDLEGPHDAEGQLLFVQFLQRVASLPQIGQHYNNQELANEGRRRFGMGMEVMQQTKPGVQPGISQNSGAVGPGGLESSGVDPHSARLAGDQGDPAMGVQSQLSGLLNT